MRRRVPSKRGGKRQVVGARAADSAIALDNQPRLIAGARDGKRLIVTLPYEIWVVNTQTQEVERTLELPGRSLAPFEGESEGALWIGGRHLHLGSLWNSTVSKVGTRLGGFVDYVGLLRPTLLCGVGTGGEILWDTEKEEAIHRRKASERAVTGFMVSADGRAVFADGTSSAWVLDPEHPTGHMQLRFRNTSEAAVPEEAIICVASGADGRCLLGAADGAVAWTNRVLRLEDERVPRGPSSPAIALCADSRWVYALRADGVLDRFLLAQPEPSDDDPEPEPLAPAQSTRLSRQATAMTITAGELWLGGPTSGGDLGRLWRADPAALQWSDLRLGKRTLVDPPDPAEPERAPAPTFVTTRHKVSGPAISTLAVDEILQHPDRIRVTASTGTVVERKTQPMAAEEILPADTVLLSAMVRFREGTARPALVLWPGRADDEAGLEPHRILVWGDDPRGWMLLDTPQIRAQGWTRGDVFPVALALGAPVPALAGRRAPLPRGADDPELFGALARECKKLLKVLW